MSKRTRGKVKFKPSFTTKAQPPSTNITPTAGEQLLLQPVEESTCCWSTAVLVADGVHFLTQQKQRVT